eukprot:TRINITY_DN303_c0_g1_i4.p2 TRINITY_DN303_c0_g1~~TRINITY_DN303_c0_g1_i4.p2  ORF type:complete len:214 (+),score=23.80 TRINITY_DN303_c0_g1_i4:574-1215(+)
MSLKGQLKKCILKAMIAKSMNNRYRTYINQFNTKWVCLCDDVVEKIPSWELVVRQIIKEEQIPVVFVWTSEGFQENATLSLPSSMRESIKRFVEKKTGVALEKSPPAAEIDFWICPICDEVNALSAAYCKKCFDMPKTYAPKESEEKETLPKEDQWICQECSKVNQLPDYVCLGTLRQNQKNRMWNHKPCDVRRVLTKEIWPWQNKGEICAKA